MMPFGMSLGAGGHHMFQQQSGSGALQRNKQHHSSNVRRLTIAAAAAATGTAGMHMYRQGKLPLLPRRNLVEKSSGQPLLQIPRELAEVICGAVGEIVQVAVLYPLDTIKVRCQAGGLPVRAVLQRLTAAASSPRVIVQQLYAGVVSASLASVAVGSLYYFTFCAAKRAATKMVAKAEQAQASTAAVAAAAVQTQESHSSLHTSADCQGVHHSNSSHSSSGSSSSSNVLSGPCTYPHNNGLDCHGFDPVFAAICSDDKAAAAAAAQQNQEQAGCGPSTSSSSSGSNQPVLSSAGKLQSNILAACAAAVVGALVEAPVELFKHRAQAGQIQGAMLPHVIHALQQQGPAALYGSFFVPFLFKSLPFDIGELMTYSSLNDWRSAHKASSPQATVPGKLGNSPRPADSLSETGYVAAVQSCTPSVPDSHMLCSEAQHHTLARPALASLTTASLSNSAVSGALDLGSSGSGRSSAWAWPGQVATNLPDHVWDMAVGAAAGAAAVLISMPPDCIKTVMETGGGVQAAAGGGPLRSAAAFVGTGRQLVQHHGPGGLFMGLTPRLVESVPSTMLYWLAVEGCRRMLEPYVAPEAGSVASMTSSSSGTGH